MQAVGLLGDDEFITRKRKPRLSNRGISDINNAEGDRALKTPTVRSWEGFICDQVDPQPPEIWPSVGALSGI
jgi:hypothetical protein